MKKNNIVITEEDLVSLICNDLTFNSIKFTKRELCSLLWGEIVEIDNYCIILQDIGADRIESIVDKHIMIIH